MPDLPIGGTETAGFEPEDAQGEWLDDHAAATLLAMKAEHEGKQDARWTCTRAQLIDALASIEAHPVLISDRTGMIVAEQMADAILGQLPEAGPDSRDSEITRLRQALADKDGEIAILRGQVTT